MQTKYAGILLILMLVYQVAAAQENHNNMQHQKNKEVEMTTIQNNKETVRKLYEEALNKRNMKLLSNYISENFTGPGGLKGVAGFEEPVQALIKSFPDVQWKIQELVGDGNQVVVRWEIHGTHTNQFQNFAATGKKVSSGGIGFYEFKNDKIINAYVQTDRFAFLQQLGVLPTDLALLTNAKAKGTSQQVRFIDKFIVPAEAKTEFLERVTINRNFIRVLPGFVEDAAYERTDESGNLIFITIAVWQNEDSLKTAKEAVQAEYKKQGFNPAQMFDRLNIKIDRGIYTEAK
jgi:steroid delta-isomerase-like uncharacterized protein